jgi:RNA polymerase sigma-70 factor, ECF subfamily
MPALAQTGGKRKEQRFCIRSPSRRRICRVRQSEESLAMAEPVSAEQDTVVVYGDFADMVSRHQSMVFSIALHFLADPSAAEELAQDVFLQLHANLRSLKSPEHVVFWLRKVTTHRCIDRKRRSRLPEVSLEDMAESSISGFSPSMEPGDPILARRLRQLVASLPEKARLIVILRYQEDLSAEEIADVLGIPVNTVKSHLQRSLEMLREKAIRTIGEGKI